ncbi:MAG: ankyrin repeat domain-containing protein [Betaproteobacteria bacterium]|nr:ankyrin repeat domain-containing protein [Betaproteobacteria bacterium]
MFALFSFPAAAIQPDPVAFGLTVERGDTRAVKQWFEAGLNPEYQADRIGTGLMIAAWNGDIEMMKLFVEHGANTRRANKMGEQPLQLAAWNGHLEAVKWLLEHGATINRGNANWSALHYAVFNGHEDVAHYLLEHGADINARSPNGTTPLMVAAREGQETMARILLQAGADTQLSTDWNDTALSFAMRYQNLRIGKMISTPQEFQTAVNAPQEAAPPSRSTAAPTEVEQLLHRIREADAAGLPSGELKEQLFTLLSEQSPPSTPPQPERLPAKDPQRAYPKPVPPKSMIVTAKRRQPGSEKVEIEYGSQVPHLPGKGVKGPTRGGINTVTPGQVSDLLRQIRVAEAQGAPTDDLKRQLDEALAKMKQ